MSPDVLLRKLERLAYYYSRLKRWEGISPEQFEDRQHEIERYLQALADIASDILHHLIALEHEPPDSKRAAAELAGRYGTIPEDLAARLARAIGQRNILVHGYEDIDSEQVRAAIPHALRDYAEFADSIRKRCTGPPSP